MPSPPSGGRYVLHLGGLDTEEHRAMLPAYELAKKSLRTGGDEQEYSGSRPAGARGWKQRFSFVRVCRGSDMTTFRHYFVNPAALGYLAVVVAVWVWVAVDLLFVEHADAGLAGVWAFLVTAPTSLLFVALPGPLPWIGLVAGAVVQAGVLGALYRALFGRPPHRTDASSA